MRLTTIRNQMRQGEVRVNGEKAGKERAVFAGDEVKIFLPDKLEPAAQVPDIAYADENIAVVNKPVLCETETHLTALVRTLYPAAVPVHRLDRNTRGLVIFSLNEAAEKELLRFFKERKIEKYYRARVLGAVEKPAQKITVYLKKDPQTRKVLVSDTPKKGYLTAQLSYTVIGREGGDTWVDICLHTGRTHQIRATMAHLCHPVIGDGKYGSEAANRARDAKFQQLVAYKICFSKELCGSDPLGYLAGFEIALPERGKNYPPRLKGEVQQ